MPTQSLDPTSPSLCVACLKLWVHGRQFPAAKDYWDGNWLDVSAQCEALGSSVRADGAIVHVGEIVKFLADCEKLYETLRGTAKLDCMEPNLRIVMTAKTGGHVDIQIEITPDHLRQRHEFREHFDQTFLPGIITQCREILAANPVRDPQQRILK